MASLQESVDLQRKLAEEQPEAFPLDLAGSLHALSEMQSAFGQREAGLASRQEAVRVAERMAPEAERLLEATDQPRPEGERLAMAKALALCNGGDPRLREERRWVEVPAGWYWRGAAEEDPNADEDETPAGLVEVSGFQLQRWPVTVGEYLRFVDAKGYEMPAPLWSPEGLAWREKDAMTAPDAWVVQLRRPHNVPVTGVSWWGGSVSLVCVSVSSAAIASLASSRTSGGSIGVRRLKRNGVFGATSGGI